MSEPLVTFCVTVSRQRAAYLYECLKRKLCPDCSRELDACEADPCTLRRVHLGELEYCYQCGSTFDPAVVVAHVCVECRTPGAHAGQYDFTSDGRTRVRGVDPKIDD